MKKTIILFLTIVIMMTATNAEIIPIPINYTYSVEFINTTNLNMYLPNGIREHLVWNTNEIHPDIINREAVMWYNLNKSQWCGEYENVNMLLDGFVDLCKDKINRTETLGKEVIAAKKDREIYENLKNICEDSRADLRNESAECQIKEDKCDKELEGYRTTVSTLQANTNKLKTCEKDLENTKKGRGYTFIFAFLLGGLAGYLLWGRKKSNSPSEQQESGGGGAWDYTSAPNQRTVQFDDEPKH